MYFKNRVEAGQKLAKTLIDFKGQKPAVIALSDGAVVIAAQIAVELQCVVTMLLSEPIKLPGEPDAVAVINQEGTFTYNDMYSTGQLEEFQQEYYQVIEQAKLEKMSEMNRLLGKGGLIRKDLLKGHSIILVSDGLSNGLSVESAIDYLKPLKTEQIIIATPLASLAAVDRMHVLTDGIKCLSVIENFINTNHYYEDNSMPDHEAIIGIIQNLVQHWQPATDEKQSQIVT